MFHAHTASAITISGTLYTDEGVTASTVGGKVLTLRVGTSTAGFFATTTLSGTGFYQFTGVTTGMDAGIPIALWVDGDSGFRAFAFTKASSSVNNITNFDLYQNRIKVKHEGILSSTGTTTSNAELGLYDGDDDVDIMFTANANNLVVRSTQKLLIAYGTHYVPGGNITLHGNAGASPDGDFQLEQRNGTSSMMTLGGALSVAGSYFASSSSILNPAGYTITFTASTTGKSLVGEMVGDSAFADLSFAKSSGAWTFRDNASTTNNFNINAGSTTLPALLTVAGNFTNYGTLTHNSGTVYISSTSPQVLYGNMATTSPLYNVVIDGASTKSFGDNFARSLTTTESNINFVEHDAVNGVLYAGSYSSGIIYRCALSTLCDATGDWTTSYDTTESSINEFVIDTTNSILYVGTSPGGIIYRCALSTSCDTSGDWTTSYDTTDGAVLSLVIDTTNSVLYAATSPNGIIYRCVLSTSCDAGGDWTTSYDTTQTIIYSLAVDPINGVLYAGTNNGGIIYRCLLSTSCDAGGDWTTSYDTAATTIYTIAIDTTNNIVYAGANNSVGILRCDFATLCDAAGDWTVSNANQSEARRIIVDQANGVIYASTDSNGVIYRCDTSTACDAAGDWTTLYDHPVTTTFLDLSLDTTNDILYMASSPGGIYRCPTRTLCATNVLTANNLTVNAASTLAIPVTVTLSGNYSPDGTIVATTTTTGFYFTGNSTQTIFGYVDVVSFPRVSFSGSGVKTILNNATSTSDFIIESGATVVAPEMLTVYRDFLQYGTYTNNSGTLFLSGLGGVATGTLTGVSALGNVVAPTGSDVDSFTTSYDTPETSVYALVVDAVNGVLYAGTSANGIIYRCLLSTSCDAGGDWTTSYDSSESNILAMTIDTTNGTLYAGTGSGGIIYRCALSTSCDAGGDWTMSYDSSESNIYTLTIDSTNGTLYAGSSFGGIIYRCALSTSCDAGGDWTISYDTAEFSISSLTIDSANGVLYAGSSFGGIIYRCLLSTSCDAAGDWAVGYDTTASTIASLAFDSANSILYAGTSAGGIIIRCDTTTSCDAGGDWTTSYDTPETSATLVVDATNGVLYAGTGSSGIIYRCLLSTSCDAAGDWTTSYDSSATTITALAIDSANGTLYTGSDTVGIINRRAGGPVFGANASTTNLTIGTGKSLTAPSGALTVGKDFTSNGSYIHNGGTLHLSGLGAAVAGNLTGSSALGNVVVPTNTGFDSFTTSYDTPTDYIVSFAVDAINGTLYAGTASGGIIYRCLLSTSCDAAGDWTTSYDTTETIIYSLAVDPINGVLYAGTNSGGIIYRCLLSTSCDAAGDWTTSYDTAETYVYTMVVDSTNGTLYAGTRSSGIIYRCDTTTSCDAAGDWTTSYDTPDIMIYTMTIDTINGVLYAGAGSNGTIYRCLLSTSCDAAGDWTTSYATPQTNVYAMTFDAANGILYAGTISNGLVYRCDTTTACDAAGDWTTSYDIGGASIYSMTIDSINGVLYVGTGFDGIIYRCAFSTSCDAAGDWTTSYDMPEILAYSMTFDVMNNTVYVGSASNGIIYRRAGGPVFSANASTTNFSISAGKTVNTFTSFSVAGNYANSGGFIASSSGTTTFNGGSAQTLSGTMTGTSTFANIAFTGAGTKTFANNASSSHFLIDASAGAVSAPPLLSINGNYMNSGIFTAGSGTTTLSGTTRQTLSGTMVGASAWSNLTITNAIASTTFNSAASTTGNFFVNTPNVRVEFAAGVTTTLQNLTIAGTSGNEIYLYSNTPASPYNIHVPGIANVSYGKVKDSDACSTSGGITPSNSIDGGNTFCWIFSGGSPTLNLLHYRFRIDHESEVSAGYYTSEDAALANRVYLGDRVRLRTTVSNSGSAAATAYNYRLEYSSSSCSTWSNLGANEEWFPDYTQYVYQYASTTDSASLSNPGGYTFQSGIFRAGSATTGAYTLPNAFFTEHEFTLNSTSRAQRGVTYCFRLTNDGSIANFVYTTQPQLIIRADAHPSSGGQNIETSGSGPAVGGGGQGGGSSSESGGSGGSHGGGGQGGGGGDSG